MKGAPKLGKHPPKYDPRTLRFSRYVLPSELPPLPMWVKWSSLGSSNWGAMGNLDLGDCVIAAKGHAIQAWTASRGAEVTISDADVIADYSAETGYDPNAPLLPDGSNPTDQGANELDALKYWRTTGIAGHKIGAFTSLTCQPQIDLRELQECVFLFGLCYIGVALPIAVQGQNQWIYPNIQFPALHPEWRAGSWGGHAVCILDYDRIAGTYTCISWGQPLVMNAAFAEMFIEEAYGIISPDFVQPGFKGLNGFDLAALTADLSAIGTPG